MKTEIFQKDLAATAGISTVTVNRLLAGKCGCTKDTALRLTKAAKWLGVDIPPEYWTFNSEKAKAILKGGV